MQLIAEAAIAALIVLGGLFSLVGSWGLAKLPSLMTRLHGPTKATTLGVGGALIASMIYFPVFQDRFSAHELLITIFLFLTAPVSANMIAKAHLHTACRGAAGQPVDEQLPEPGNGVQWATFQSFGDVEDEDATAPHANGPKPDSRP
ncbi:MAG: Na+/H+ antiporter subunit G [Phenylobacterium sp.]|uniref:Na+/H+ antiporter subunit G n=1 Tax=Phenylobacterium sp. TaxID=1871053 RepID=UPI002731BCA2|nr:Na+/H+ antiporter subunit G [Phenylobacterium sp.]MDP2009010.1 Na+/H+ antiporter subunit G [Phenylobacterium sp.]